MSEHTIKYTVTPFIDFTNETLSIKIELPDQQIAREVVNLKEQAVRQGLIALGWTPPGLADRLFTACRSLQENHPESWYYVKEALAAYENHKKQTP